MKAKRWYSLVNENENANIYYKCNWQEADWCTKHRGFTFRITKQ